MAKYPLRWFEAVYEEMAEKGLGAVPVCRVERRRLLGVVLIYSPSSTHYFHNGSKYEFLKFCPNELLIHSALEEAVGKGSSDFSILWVRILMTLLCFDLRRNGVVNRWMLILM